MVLINKAINEVTVKLVYYGPGLCGKTTNLEKVYGNPKLENKGKMISMSTETDRTLFFDFMPMELGTIAGQKIRVQLYTVPGQVFYDATRKLVLRGADGVVFVADSQNTMRESNIDSLENLKTNLRLNRIDPEKVALVYQLNKRDLPNVDSVETMKGYLQAGNAPVVEAAAIQGTGVTATLRAAVSRILDNLKNNVDTTLHEQPELTAPDMSVKAGVSHSSAGTPKLSMRTEPPAPPPRPQTLAPTPAATVAPPPAPGPQPVRAPEPPPRAPEPQPVLAPEPQPVAASPFFAAPDFSDIGTEMAEEDPFGSVAVVEVDPAVGVVDSPFNAPDEFQDRDGERMEMEALLTTAREVTQSLENALERAREHERAIEERIARL